MINYQSTAKPLLIYIHGFISSPKSAKALETQHFLTRRAMVIDYHVPALSDYPQQAYAQLAELIEQNPDRKIGLIGSSLGGFYASALSAHYGCKAVLVNPAVAPYKRAEKFLGPQLNPYTENAFELTANDMAFLAELEVECPSPDNILLLVQTGDEVLNYQDAVDRFVGAKQVVEQGGDHRFQDYERHLLTIIKFLFAPSQ